MSDRLGLRCLGCFTRGLLLASAGGLPGLFLGMAMIDAFGRLTTLSLMQVRDPVARPRPLLDLSCMGPRAAAS